MAEVKEKLCADGSARLTSSYRMSRQDDAVKVTSVTKRGRKKRWQMPKLSDRWTEQRVENDNKEMGRRKSDRVCDTSGDGLL